MFKEKKGRTEVSEEQSRSGHETTGKPIHNEGDYHVGLSESKQAEEALQKREAKLRTIFERVAVGIGLVDVEGRLMESNPALQEILGYSEKELQNRVFTEFTHPDDLTADTNLYKELLEGKRDHHQTEKRFIRKDGEVIWSLQNVSLVRASGGEPLFMVFMVEDITERKRLENHFLQSQKMETVGRLEEN